MKTFVVSVLCLVVLGIPQRAAAAVDVFVCSADFPGESTAVGFQDCIEADLASETGFLDGTTVSFRDIRFESSIHRSSVPLRTALADRRMLQKIVITATNDSSGSRRRILELTLTDAKVASVAADLSSPDQMTESVSLRPREVCYRYYRYAADGSVTEEIVGCIDYETGTPVSAAR